MRLFREHLLESNVQLSFVAQISFLCDSDPNIEVRILIQNETLTNNSRRFNI